MRSFLACTKRTGLGDLERGVWPTLDHQDVHKQLSEGPKNAGMRLRYTSAKGSNKFIDNIFCSVQDFFIVIIDHDSLQVNSIGSDIHICLALYLHIQVDAYTKAYLVAVKVYVKYSFSPTLNCHYLESHYHLYRFSLTTCALPLFHPEYTGDNIRSNINLTSTI